jgi:hypothetical protein
MNQLKRFVVKYAISVSHKGEEIVYGNPNDSQATIIEKCKSQLRKKFSGSLPFGYQNFTVTSEDKHDE